MLKPAAKPRLEVSNRAEPFSWRDGVGDSVKPPVGSTVVGVGIQYYVIKKIRASANSDILIMDECLYKIPVNPAAWKIHNLF